jgi:hypothetical protein
MADYGAPESRYHGSRPTNYGGPAEHQRDAAFHNIFGGAPPGRSQTMTTQPANTMYERAPSMTSSGMQAQHTMSMRQGPPPAGRHMPQPYDRTNGVAPGPPYMNGPRQAPYNGAPNFPDRRPYPPPQRIDPRMGPPSSMSMSMAYDRKPVPNRMPPPALNNDSFRSRSMVRPGEPTLGYRPPPSSFQQGTASSFRQQPYATVGTSRTTAQGRHIPERIDDNRAMSMGSYSLDHHDH